MYSKYLMWNIFTCIHYFNVSDSGLVPENDWDAARCDMAVDYADDFRNNHNYVRVFFYTEREAQVCRD
jgi:hypothetical protein